MSNDKQLKAIRNLDSGFYPSERIPNRVFTRQFKRIYAMDYSRLFSQDAVKLFKLLMAFDRSHAVAIGCFQQSMVALPSQQGQTKDWKADTFLVSADTKDETYMSFLRRNWSEYGQRKATQVMLPPWIIYAEVVGACSDVGDWYIYGEKVAEIALLVFCTSPGAFLEKRLHYEFGIEKLVDALKKDTFFGDPGNEHSKQQRAILRAAYLAMEG